MLKILRLFGTPSPISNSTSAVQSYCLQSYCFALLMILKILKDLIEIISGVTKYSLTLIQFLKFETFYIAILK